MAMESLTTKDPSPVLVDSPSASSSKGATNTPSTEVVEMQSVPVAATTALFVASAKEERIVEATESSPAVSTSHIGHPSSAISATLHDLSSSTTHSTAGQVVNNPLPSPPSPHQTTIPQRVEETHPPSAVSSTSLAADYVNQPLPPIPTSPSFNPLQQQQQQQQLHIQTNRIEQEPYQRPPSHPPSPASVPTLARPASVQSQQSHSSSAMNNSNIGSQDPAQQIRFARFAQCTAESMPMSGTPVNDPRKRLLDDAFAIIDRLAKANNGEAVYIKGTWYAAGKMGNTRDADKALKYYQRAAKLGYPKASFQIGRHYENDPNRAMQFYQRASALGDADANYRMGTIYLNGDLKQKPNPSQALKYLKRAATGADHQLKLPYYSLNYSLIVMPNYELIHWIEMPMKRCTCVPGRFDRDDRAAFEWCRKAVEQGLADAEYAFGYYHEAGIGVQMDKDVAMAWFRKAAAGGSALARERLQQLESGSMNSNMMMSNHQKPPPIIPGYGHLPPPPPSNTSASAATTHYQAAGPPSNITMNHQQGYPSNMMSPTSPSGPLGASFNPPPPPQQPPPSLHHPYHHNGPPANYMAMSGYGGQPQPQQPPPPPQHRPSMGYGQGLPYHQGPPPQQSPQQPPYRR
ncbi:hypothetical protein BDF22DRAFT_656739 [Syncephalis plumigaleata]|nr:hypothetical protein BDF22DRAFT_656739 [Syncephalis plumigaleata]